MTNQEIKDALMNYHRAPKLISEELEIIRNCESEREEFKVNRLRERLERD
jgi:hypothetical protein